MSKFTTVSGAEINYTATEVSKRITSEVDFTALGFEDTIIVSHADNKESLEAAITMKLEGLSNKFRKAQQEARNPDPEVSED